MPKVCQTAFRNVGISIQVCSGEQREVSFLMETFTSPKNHLCCVLGPLDLRHGLKRHTNFPRTLSFCQVLGQTGMCLLKGWQHQMYFLGVKLEENMKVPVYSCHSRPCLPICLRTKLFVTSGGLSWCSVDFTSPTSCFSPHLTFDLQEP